MTGKAGSGPLFLFAVAGIESAAQVAGPCGIRRSVHQAWSVGVHWHCRNLPYRAPPLYQPPRLALSVGITGHRPNRLPLDVQPVANKLRQVLQSLRTRLEAEQAGLPGCFSDEPPLLRVVSPLAEGADTLTAEAALATGCELDICLPFHRDEYAHDFETATAREHFHALLGHACGVIELAGDRKSEAAAYESVGRVTLALSDVMIAVWDGEPANGRGGTAEILAEAVERGIPVIHVSVEGSNEPCVIWAGLGPLPLSRPTLWTAPRCCLADCLPGMVHLLVAPPTRGERPDALDDLGKRGKRTLYSHLAWPALLAALDVRRLRRTDWKPAMPEEIAHGNRSLAGEGDEFGRRLGASLIGPSAQVDALANQFGQTHRSGYVLNFVLASIAVLFAAIGVLWETAKTSLVTGELVIILLVVVNTLRGTAGHWHERWLDYRHLAERLRILIFTLPLGEQLLRFDFDRGAGGVPDWVRWRARAAARATGMPSFIVTPALVGEMRQRLFAVIDGQVAYHRENAHRMHLLDHRTHLFGQALVLVTLLMCAGYLLDHFGLLSIWPDGISIRGVTILVTIFCPALGAALYGIRAQSDFAGVEHRSGAMARELERLRRAMEADAPRYELVTDRARRLATVMLRDTADWRLTFSGRPLVLPG